MSLREPTIEVQPFSARKQASSSFESNSRDLISQGKMARFGNDGTAVQYLKNNGTSGRLAGAMPEADGQVQPKL